MRILKNTLVMATLVMFCLPVIAQENSDELDDQMREAERRLVEQEREIAEVHRVMEVQRAERERVIYDESIEVEVRMREAEESLAEAARQVAELSIRQLPRVAIIERIMRGGHGPVLGITIGADDDDDPVEGVAILGVSPGGAAAESGFRAGDIITAINGESLTAGNDREANAKLLDFMQGVEAGVNASG